MGGSPRGPLPPHAPCSHLWWPRESQWSQSEDVSSALCCYELRFPAPRLFRKVPEAGHGWGHLLLAPHVGDQLSPQGPTGQGQAARGWSGPFTGPAARSALGIPDSGLRGPSCSVGLGSSFCSRPSGLPVASHSGGAWRVLACSGLACRPHGSELGLCGPTPHTPHGPGRAAPGLLAQDSSRPRVPASSWGLFSLLLQLLERVGQPTPVTRLAG